MRNTTRNAVENESPMGVRFTITTGNDSAGRMYDQGVLLGYQWAMSRSGDELQCDKESMLPATEGFIHLDEGKFDRAFSPAGRLGVAGYVAEYMEPFREGDERLRLEFWESVLGFNEGTDEFAAAMQSADFLRGFVNGVFVKVYG